ncbi:replication initiation protein [Larkinella insperata]|uniref:Replication initiation protein n=1 Tax=Larkinella insperata TaxID=332158 RepID=A0ABW3QGY5_9BACT
MTDSRPDRIVAQHNDLIKAQYDMSLLEMRLFVAMLARINRGDSEFSICRIPVSELYPDSEVGGKTYSQVKKAVMRLVSRSITIETKDARGVREVVSNPLMATCRYKEGTGFVIAQFNNFVKPYLLELKGDFTRAQELTLIGFRSFYSFRVYWLLKLSAYNKDIIVMELTPMKQMLNLVDRYANFADFKRFVLDVAQQEIASTDMAFEYTTKKEGRQVVGVQFNLLRPAVIVQEDTELPDGVQQRLNEIGMSLQSLQEIKSFYNQGKLADDYLRFVLEYYDQTQQKGRIRSLAGVVYKALMTDLLRREFEVWKAQQPVYKAPASKPVEPSEADQRALEETERHFKQALETLIQHPEWATQVETHMQKGLLGHFYRKDRSLAENIKNPSLIGPFLEIMEKLSSGL